MKEDAEQVTATTDRADSKGVRVSIITREDEYI